MFRRSARSACYVMEALAGRQLDPAARIESHRENDCLQKNMLLHPNVHLLHPTWCLQAPLISFVEYVCFKKYMCIYIYEYVYVYIYIL